MSIRRATIYCARVIESWRACTAARSSGEVGAFAAATWRALVIAEVVAILANGQLPEFSKLRGSCAGPWTVEDARRMVNDARSSISYALRDVNVARMRHIEMVADAWICMVESELLNSPWAIRSPKQEPPTPVGGVMN